MRVFIWLILISFLSQYGYSQEINQSDSFGIKTQDTIENQTSDSINLLPNRYYF